MINICSGDYKCVYIIKIDPIHAEISYFIYDDIKINLGKLMFKDPP